MHKPDILLSSLTWQFICHWEFCCCCSEKKNSCFCNQSPHFFQVTEAGPKSGSSHHIQDKAERHKCMCARTQLDFSTHTVQNPWSVNGVACFSGWIFPQQRGQIRQSPTGLLTGCPGLDYPSWASLTNFFQVVLLSNHSLQFLWRQMGIWGRSI